MSSAAHPLFLLGARGLLAGEFLRLLDGHPCLRLAGAYARSAEGALGQSHPHLAGALAATPLEEASALADALKTTAQAGGPAPVLLLALPHGASAPWWAEHRAALQAACPALVVVDLSADFRLESAEAYQASYALQHPCPDEFGQWIYGLPELHPVPEGSKRIAVPGCFATAMQLAVVPMARAAQIEATEPIIVHGVTGSSGSGAQAKAGTHHPHRAMNFHAYGLQGHRHEAELLSPRNALPQGCALDFTPHSAPLSRGIHLHAVMQASAQADEQPQAVLETFCADKPFLEAVRQAPQLRHIAGSQRVQLHAYRRGRLLHVLVALDNTIKGGAGQALQALNLALGLPETTALPSHGLGY